MAFKFHCRCLEAHTRWVEQAPASTHRYRVQCNSCGKLIAWGTETQLQDYQAKFEVTLITWANQQARPTLDRFFE